MYNKSYSHDHHVNSLGFRIYQNISNYIPETFISATYYPTSTFTTPPDTNYTFPSCNVSEIPPGYCRCNISIQTPKKVDNSVEELIQNLTVNKDETSKSRRKLTSADDDRPSAKAVGVVGLIVLITFAVVLFVFDFNVLMEQAIMCAKLLKKVLNIKKWKTGKED